MNFGAKLVAALLGLVAIAIVLTSFERPPVTAIQRGYRGVGIVTNYNPRLVAKTIALNAVPAPEDKQDPAGQPSSAVYKNVKVLGNLDANEFLRLMAAITTWVAPQQGCAYCHNVNNLADDSLYTKRVARRMIQMTWNINANWQTHVQNVGVTCYTCHRGNPVPKQIWFNAPSGNVPGGMAETQTGKNHPTAVAGYASLPDDPFTPFLEQAKDIRVVSTQALPGTDLHSIKQTDWTYSLMIHFSNALGVNCSYCHNSRAFYDWSQSSPARVNAWYGIRMVRDLNNDYLAGLHDTFPAYRWGPTGDVAKINCATCHQGIYKPLYGVSMLKDYTELAGPIAEPPPAAPAAAPAAPAPAAPAPAPATPQ